MRYTYKYHLKPTENQRQQLDFYHDTCRQLYNYVLKEFNEIPNSAGTLPQRVKEIVTQIPDLKEWWTELKSVYSTVRQAAVKRIKHSIKALSELKKRLQRRESQLEST
ncbi:MAG: helix-turn-helix domain protein [halophilic archaeon J07HX5]|jgi:Helix-turn-helix domain.|nr:MAG: helix-turn-helix domain protein [halophilic archaeon J07HX5]